MGIITLDFLYFVLASLVIFYLLPGKYQNHFLLAVSYYFYITWNWKFLLFLVGLTIFNFYFAHKIENQGKQKKYLLRIGVLLNLGFLLIFLSGDYLGLKLRNLFQFYGSTEFEINILLPIGASYYILECISYLVDVNRRQLPASSNYIDFSLYLAYFPKLISGPIERAREFLPVLREKRVINNDIIGESFALIIIGLFRSVFIAGMISILAPQGYLVDPLAYSSTELILGILAVGFRLYNLFAGYTSIVRGVSLLFGISLSKNFRQPMFSKDFSDLWTRWHISLSFWFRDYIFLPLSRSFLRRNPSRTNKANILFPPIITMLFSGLWHGGSLNLLLWGAMNGSFIILENLISLLRPTVPSAIIPVWRRVVTRFPIIFLAIISLIPFSLSIQESKIYTYGIIIVRDWNMPDFRLIAILVISIILDGLQQSTGSDLVYNKWPKWIQGFAFSITILSVIIVNEFQSVHATFIYP